MSYKIEIWGESNDTDELLADAQAIVNAHADAGHEVHNASVTVNGEQTALQPPGAEPDEDTDDAAAQEAVSPPDGSGGSSGAVADAETGAGEATEPPAPPAPPAA